MPRQNREGRRYPQDLLDDVLWSFVGEKFATQAEFVEAVREYAWQVQEEPTWDPDAVVLRSPRVRVMFDYWDEPGELSAEFAADDGDAFTAGELLFKVHNAFVEQIREADHVFFEGFYLVRQRQDGGPPLYEMYLGS
jgi:hypothetical protein